MAKTGWLAGLVQMIGEGLAGTTARTVTKRPKRKVATAGPALGSPQRRQKDTSGSAVAATMLAFSPPPKRTTRTTAPRLSAWEGYPEDAAQFTERSPNAFLFGAIFDRMITANQAWQSPYRLAKRLGHLDVRKLAKMSPAVLERFIARSGDEKALHRFPPTMARALVSASKKLVAEYGGDAAQIWAPGTPAGVVVARLQEFDGISHKIANMTARLLVTYYGAHLTGWEEIDVAVDRHVARVFLRTGLVGGTAGETRYAAAALKTEIVEAAKRLSPSFPGALDEAAFVVGRGWCNSGRAWCEDGRQPCPLLAACPGKRRGWEIE